MERIQDIKHPALANYEKLWKKKRCDKYLKAEGYRLVELALKSQFECDALFVSADFIDKHPKRLAELEKLVNARCPIYLISERLMARFSETKSPQGVILILKAAHTESAEQFLADRVDFSDFRCIVLEDVQDPGNVGSIVRTAEALAYDAVFYTSQSAQAFGEKAMRASMGSVFFIPVVKIEKMAHFLTRLKELKISTIATSLEGDPLEAKIPLTRLSIFVGNEGQGLSAEVLEQVDEHVKIPMRGQADSLNAAAAAAIVAYCLRG